MQGLGESGQLLLKKHNGLNKIGIKLVPGLEYYLKYGNIGKQELRLGIPKE